MPKRKFFPNPDDEPKLLITIILIQLVAIPGAIGMSRLSKRIGNWWVITLAVLVWIGVCAVRILLCFLRPEQYVMARQRD
ncbi:MAG: hypothetical protein QM781_10320 [Chitinophagaceae bacterium]